MSTEKDREKLQEKVPSLLRSNWEKQVAEHAESNHDSYPSLHDFAVLLMQKQATLKNHPNIIVGAAPTFEEKINAKKYSITDQH